MWDPGRPKGRSYFLLTFPTLPSLSPPGKNKLNIPCGQEQEPHFWGFLADTTEKNVFLSSTFIEVPFFSTWLSWVAEHHLTLQLLSGFCNFYKTAWERNQYLASDFLLRFCVGAGCTHAPTSNSSFSALPCTLLLQNRYFHSWLIKWLNCRVHLITFRWWDYLLSYEKYFILSGTHLEHDSNVTWHLSRELSLWPVKFCFGEVNTCCDGICHI